mmetsp:Transcript_48871/g.98343  ORF Transcript_48871/g.98343 Transcript_48871/m.98343 type:complete len:210 (+) Transcript_48871:131-760(+)
MIELVVQNNGGYCDGTYGSLQPHQTLDSNAGNDASAESSSLSEKSHGRLMPKAYVVSFFTLLLSTSVFVALQRTTLLTAVETTQPLCDYEFCVALNGSLGGVNMLSTTLREYCEGDVGSYKAELTLLMKRTESRCEFESMCSRYAVNGAMGGLICGRGDESLAKLIGTQHSAFNATTDCGATCTVINSAAVRFRWAGAETCAELYPHSP